VITQDEIKQVNTEDGRYYELEIDGQVYKLMSVTTVIGAMLHKPSLMAWSYNIGIEQAVQAVIDKVDFELGRINKRYEESHNHQELLEEATKVLEGLEDIDHLKVKQYLKDKERGYEAQRSEAASRGTSVHEIFENICKGEAYISGAEETPYVRQIKKFVDDYQPEFLESELKVFSLEKEYAGTLDTVCRINAHPPRRRHKSMVGETVVLDLKTNKDGKIYPDSHFLQVTAYENAYKEMGGNIDGGMVLAVGPESYSVGHNYFDSDSFNCILDAYNMIDKCKRMNPNARKK
jgi:hypothetical protein